MYFTWQLYGMCMWESLCVTWYLVPSYITTSDILVWGPSRSLNTLSAHTSLLYTKTESCGSLNTSPVRWSLMLSATIFAHYLLSSFSLIIMPIFIFLLSALASSLHCLLMYIHCTTWKTLLTNFEVIFVPATVYSPYNHTVIMYNDCTIHVHVHNYHCNY